MNDIKALSEPSDDHNLLAWSNSLRRDLLALGLARRERATLNLASYLARGRDSENDDVERDDANEADTTTTTAAA
jgi:hypothetical protein